MNLLLLEEGDRITARGDHFRVDGGRARHLREVLRVMPGRRLRVGLVDGPKGEGEVTGLDDLTVELACRFESAAEPRPPVDLLLAVPRPRSLQKLLPEVAAFGVDCLVLLNTWRVAKPYLSVTLLHPDRYRPLLREGMSQGGVTHEPRVRVEPLFRPFVEDRLPELLRGAVGWLAHPAASRRLAEQRIGAAERLVLFVGPEGGLIPFEVDLLEAHGLTPVSMGGRTLRVETACVGLLAQADLLRQQNRCS